MGAQGARGEALVDPLKLRHEQAGQKGRIGGRTDDGSHVEHGATGRRQPPGTREHRIAHGRRDAAAGGQDLGDEEGVAAGPSVEFLGVDIASGGETTDGVHGERADGEPVDGRGRRKVAQHGAQGMAWSYLVVTVGDHHQGGDRIQPTAKEPEQIERGLVGPVGVLDHSEGRRRPGAKLGQRRAEGSLARHIVAQQPIKRPPGLRRYIEQRPKWPRR